MASTQQSYVGEAFSATGGDDRSGISLEDGSRVAVVGGGPAGSFFSYFLLKMAGTIDLDVTVDIFDPRSFSNCGPAGCNHCGGIVSETLIQILAAEGINLPRSVVQRGIESYVVHMDVGSVAIESLSGEMRIAALYRGNGPREGGEPPREGGESPWESFDGYLQNMTKDMGAKVVRQLITGVDWRDGYPWLQFADHSETRYDLIAVASGVNSNFINMLDAMPVTLKPPRTTRTFICEFKSSEAELLEILGNAVHVFLLAIPRLEFAAIIPKGDFATVVMVGEDLDQELVHDFLNDPVVRDCFPTDSTPCVCSCSPLINLKARSRPYGDRMVMVGDSGVTRLYKDGIGAAFRTAKAAASTAVFQGISEQAFESKFWPACRRINNDNAIGAVMFASTGLFKRFRFLRRIMYSMAAREQQKANRKPHMSSMLWNMFTGSAPYTEILLDAMHPGFIGHFGWNLLNPMRKKVKVKKDE
jgi:flavin-dependent dehydrogenase